MIGAEVEHEGTRSGGRKALRPLAAPLRGSPGGLLRAGYRTVRRLIGAGEELLFRRRGVLVGFAQAVAAQQEDFGVLHQPVGDGGSDGRIEIGCCPSRKTVCWW